MTNTATTIAYADIKRELLFSIKPIKWKISSRSKWTDVPAIGKSYWRVPYWTKGGSIYAHFHTTTHQPGQTFRANVEVWKKTYPDGTEVLYLDLHPIKGGKVTKELKVFSHDHQLPEESADCHVFRCYGDVQGGVVFRRKKVKTTQ